MRLRAPFASGTSPRVRGKRIIASPARLLCRYIPASAGEAVVRVFIALLAWVHPRECGGSAAKQAAIT